MRQSIEEVFLTNYAVDLLLLISALRARRLINVPRLLSAAFAGALAGCAVALADVSRALELIIAVALCPALALIACGKFDTKCCVRLFGASALTAGLCAALGGVSGMACALAICALSCATAAIMRPVGDWTACLALTYNGEIAEFDALIDTGNKLFEPVSGLTAMVVESALIDRLLPEDFDPQSPLKNLPRGFRTVSYGGVGGQGVMGAFMPDDITITRDGIKRRAPDIWVCAYPGKLPGKTRALLPPTAIL